MNVSYYNKADAILLVYDISNRKSFDKIKNYYCKKIKECCKKNNIPIILLGNKADLPNREVQTEEGIALALQEKYKFKETSCVKNENVADAFEALIEMWNIENIKQMNKEKNDENKQNKDLGTKNKENHSNSLTLKNKQKDKKKSGCC